MTARICVGVMPSIDAAQPRLEGHVLRRLEQERIEVEHAELPVADPRLALAHALERADVHEGRPRALELHVVRRRVLQDHVVVERREQQVELEERRVLQHREGPLVWVRDERDPLVAKHGRGLVHEQVTRRGHAVRALRPDHALVVEQAGGLERLEVGQAVGRERAEDVVACIENPALRVTEGAGLQVGGRGWGRHPRKSS